MDCASRRGGPMKVCVKNTFLSFEGDQSGDDDSQTDSGGHTPRLRSRSVECAGTPNRASCNMDERCEMSLKRLNDLWDEVATRCHSPTTSSRAPSNHELNTLEVRLGNATFTRSASLPETQMQANLQTVTWQMTSESSGTCLSEHATSEDAGVELGPTVFADPDQVSSTEVAFDLVIAEPRQESSQHGPLAAPQAAFSELEQVVTVRPRVSSAPLVEVDTSHVTSRPAPLPGDESPKERKRAGSASSPSHMQQYRHGDVPKNVNLAKEYGAHKGPVTTLMIRNLPNRYTQAELIEELGDMGLGGAFNFLYIPLDTGTLSNVGYAFVNFVHYSWAERCMKAFQNYRFKRHRRISGKIAAISIAHIQGLEANMAHYEKSAINSAKLKQRRPIIFPNMAVSMAE